MTVSVAIMAHPRRAAWIPELVDAIDADVTIVWDERDDRWDTGRRALLAHDLHATHHMVIQDDAIVCRELTAGITEAVKMSGPHPIGLYMGRVKPAGNQIGQTIHRAQMARATWIEMKGPWWGVGLVLPTSDIADAVAFGDARVDIANYDRKLARFYEHRGIRCWYTVPSLVEHRHGEGNPSLIKGRTGTNRQAWLFIGEDRSAVGIDWTIPPIEVLEIRSHRRRQLMADDRPIATWASTDGRTRKVRAGSSREERYKNHSDWQLVGVTGEADGGAPAGNGSLGLRGGKGGWWEIVDPDGQVLDKVRGRDAAEARQAELVVADG